MTRQTAQQLMIAHASNQQIHAGTENGLSEEMKAELLKLLNENLTKINEEKKRERLARKASRRNIAVNVDSSSSTGESVGSRDEDEVVEKVEPMASIPKKDAEGVKEMPVGTPTPEEAAKAAFSLVELTPTPTELPAPAPASAATSEPITLTNTKEFQTIIRETHYITYVHTADRFYWLKLLAFLLLIITVVTQKYFDMQQEHLYECGYPPEYKCLCFLEGWLGLEEQFCKCVFWPRTC
ncbi:hypothetical protein EV426DRAFT_628006 [Tirmania nivea]|nr:hypothetical protein EV426DRAFT_628006 [Tirmania nivea]